MGKEDNRRVLLSIKVSTLLKIFIIIVFAIVVMFNLPNTVKVSEDTNIKEIDNDETFAVKPEENQMIAAKEGEKVVVEISSRSLEAARKTDLVSVEESVLEAQAEELITVAPESTPIEDVTISVDMDLTVRTGLSREDFIKLMTDLKPDTSGFFEENAGKIYDVCEQYSINEIFFVGLISAESGWGIAGNHRRTYNYISLMSNSGLIRFSSVDDGLESAARILHDRYLTPGGSCYNGKTLSGVKVRFCPASSTWVSLVYGRMKQVL